MWRPAARRWRKSFVWSGRSEAQVFIGRQRVAWRSRQDGQDCRIQGLQDGLALLASARLRRCQVLLDGDLAELHGVPAVGGLTAQAEAQAAAQAWLRSHGRIAGRVGFLRWPVTSGCWPAVSVEASDWELLVHTLGSRAVSIRPWWSDVLGFGPGHRVALDAHGLHHLSVDEHGSVDAAATLRSISSAGAIERWLQRQQASEAQPLAALVRLQGATPELPSPWTSFDPQSKAPRRAEHAFELLERAKPRPWPAIAGGLALVAAGAFASGSWTALSGAEARIEELRARQTASSSRDAAQKHADAVRVSSQTAGILGIRVHAADVLRALEDCHPEGAQALQLQLDAMQGTGTATVKGPAEAGTQDWLACLNHRGDAMDWQLVRIDAERDGHLLMSVSTTRRPQAQRTPRSAS